MGAKIFLDAKFTFSVVLLAFLVDILYQTSQLKNPESRMFPFMVAFASLACVIVQFASDLKEARRKRECSEESRRTLFDVALIMVVLILFILISAIWSYLFATPVLLLVLVKLIGKQSWRSSLVTIAVTELSIWLLFVRIMGIR